MGKREENKLQTRRALLDAARSLAVEQGNFPGLDDVAARAGVSRATLFNYFGGKDELVTEIFAERLQSLADRVDEQLTLDISTAERIGSLFAAFVRAQGAQSRFFLSLIEEVEKSSSDTDAVTQRHQIFDAQLRRLVDAGVARGDVRDDVSPHLLAELIRSVYITAFRDFRGDGERDLILRFDEAARFVTSAISR